MGATIDAQPVSQASSATAILILIGSRGEQDGRETIRCGHCGRGQYNRGQQRCIVCHQTLILPLEPLSDSDAPVPLPESQQPQSLRACARLKELRRLLGYSQPQLADAAGCARTHVTKYEHARVTPTIDSFQRLASGFNLSLGELLDESLSPADLALLSLIRSESGDLMQELIKSLPRLGEDSRTLIAVAAKGFSAGQGFLLAPQARGCTGERQRP